MFYERSFLRKLFINIILYSRDVYKNVKKRKPKIFKDFFYEKSFCRKLFGRSYQWGCREMILKAT